MQNEVGKENKAKLASDLLSTLLATTEGTVERARLNKSLTKKDVAATIAIAIELLGTIQ